MEAYKNDIKQAVIDLCEAVRERGDNPFPNDLIVARRTVEGMVTKNGAQSNVGIPRLSRLLNKHLGGDFEIRLTITKKGPPAL